MAEQKSEGPNDSLLWSVIGFVFIFFVIGTYIGRVGVDDGNGAIPGQTTGRTGIFSGLLDDSIEAGEKIVNTTATQVRQAIGGAIIGEQEKRATGFIVEGPVEGFGTNWYRVNYKDAPDGWVSESEITSNIGTFRALNIFPILFDIVRPIGFILTLLFIIFLFMIMSRQRKITKLEEKRKQVEKQTAQGNSFAAHLESASEAGVQVTAEGTTLFQVTPPPKGEASAEKAGAPANLPTGDMEGLVFQQTATPMDTDGLPKNAKWERVQKLMHSHVASDWKQAIIEADIMLDEMLNKMGYAGNSIGEKLKQIEESDFVTLNKAWEAHKVRNNIAHRGGDYVMSKNEAERVIGLYQKVFDEFFYI